MEYFKVFGSIYLILVELYEHSPVSSDTSCIFCHSPLAFSQHPHTNTEDEGQIKREKLFKSSSSYDISKYIEIQNCPLSTHQMSNLLVVGGEMIGARHRSTSTQLGPRPPCACASALPFLHSLSFSFSLSLSLSLPPLSPHFRQAGPVQTLPLFLPFRACFC